MKSLFTNIALEKTIDFILKNKYMVKRKFKQTFPKQS